MNSNLKLVLIMVGLPARGKSYTCNKIKRYLSWLGYNVEVFNVGIYRRKLLGGFQDFEFFNNMNNEYNKIRENIAKMVMDKLLEWLIIDNNNIGIFDATNSTIERRNMLQEICLKYKFKPLFIENICYNTNLIRDNIKLKLLSPDYKNIKENVAKKDFYNRLKNYSEIYKSITKNENKKFIKIIDNFSSIEIANANDLLEKELISYLLYIKINKYPIYLTRHGESIYNTMGLIGGNSSLSKKGKLYIKELYDFFSINEKWDNLQVFTSTLDRTIETGKLFSNKYKMKHYKILDEINAGICDGLTYSEIKDKYPQIHESRKNDKYNYRYPMGESYKDVVSRLKPFIFEIEQLDKPTLIISHNAITRVIYAYLMNIPQENIPHFDIPLHTIIKLEPNAHNYTETRFTLL